MSEITVNAGLKSKTTSVSDLNLDVIYGIENKVDGDSKPLIAISASYDAFGAAPSLPAGYETSISPVLAVLHMSRVFKRQFKSIP